MLKTNTMRVVMLTLMRAVKKTLTQSRKSSKALGVWQVDLLFLAAFSSLEAFLLLREGYPPTANYFSHPLSDDTLKKPAK